MRCTLLERKESTNKPFFWLKTTADPITDNTALDKGFWLKYTVDAVTDNRHSLSRSLALSLSLSLFPPPPSSSLCCLCIYTQCALPVSFTVYRLRGLFWSDSTALSTVPPIWDLLIHFRCQSAAVLATVPGVICTTHLRHRPDWNSGPQFRCLF